MSGNFMQAIDAFTWRMERDPTLRSTVVSVLWLEKRPDWELLRDRVDRLSRTMVTLRQRVVETPYGLATPQWVNDAHFDLDWHLRRVAAPRPKSREVVLEIARQAAMDTFDKERPLWEVTVVEGLKGGEAAVVLKIHHALTDGMGGMANLGLLFDFEADPPDRGPLPPAPVGEDVTGRELIGNAVVANVARGALAVRHGIGLATGGAWRALRNPVGTAVETGEVAGSVARFAAPFTSTYSPVMRERTMVRRLAMIDISLPELKKAAKTVGVSLNDAWLAGITGGMRRYHEAHGTSVKALRCTMPISIRKEGDEAYGNRITLSRIVLPVDEPDPVARMRGTEKSTRAARDDKALPFTEAMAGALAAAPSLVGVVLKHVDFLASNVPGSPIDLWLAGSRLTGFYAFGPTIGSSFNITMVTHGDTCGMGLTIDTFAVKDPDFMVECLREGFEEVLAIRA